MSRRNKKPYIFTILLVACSWVFYKMDSKTQKSDEKEKITYVNAKSPNEEKTKTWISNSNSLSQVGYSWHNKTKINTLSSENLEEFLHKEFPNANVHCADRRYTIVDPDWFWKYFHPYAKENSAAIKDNSRFDCDNFSSYVMLMISHLYCISPVYAKNVNGIAVGEMYYSHNGNNKDGHAINIVIACDDNGIVDIFGYDVRLNSKKILTNEEKSSTWFVKF